MFRHCAARWKPRTLHEMFRSLKLQGAHPDVLWSVDARKAQHNGAEMIRLETLFHQRASGGVKDPEPQQSFMFWLRPPGLSRGSSDVQLKQVSCTLSTRASPRVIKSQLQQLFRDAGIHDDFELGGEGVEMNLEQVLRDADKRQAEHVNQTATLYLRGDKAIRELRNFGVLVVVEEEGLTYLATMPEQAGSVGGGGIAGPSGALDSETQDFLRERNLRAFDLRMAGSYSSVERFVSAFERLEKMYDQHRGLALRPSVCLVLSLKGPTNFVADDGSIVLSMQQLPSWEEYLLGLPQPVWKECVQKHRDWRLQPAPKLMEQRRRLLKVADTFHVFGVVLEHTIGRSSLWQDTLVNRLAKEEVSIRNAIKKYKLASPLLKRRGFLYFRETLTSALDRSKDIGYRITGEGKVYFNATTMTTPMILKVLKENLATIERLVKEYDSIVSQLEFISRSLPLDFSIDSEWKTQEDTNAVNCLAKFVATVKENQAQLALFLGRMLNENIGQTYSSGVKVTPTAAAHKRLTWIVSNRFETMPSGVVFVPWDVDFESIKKMLLPGS